MRLNLYSKRKHKKRKEKNQLHSILSMELRSSSKVSRYCALSSLSKSSTSATEVSRTFASASTEPKGVASDAVEGFADSCCVSHATKNTNTKHKATIAIGLFTLSPPYDEALAAAEALTSALTEANASLPPFKAFKS